MGKPQIVWARRARKLLLQKLGGRCTFCGTRTDLTFDCIDPQDPCHADRMGNHIRMPYYHRQYRAANVQILCRHCNAVKRNRRNYWPPFNRHVKRRYLAMRRAKRQAAQAITPAAEQPSMASPARTCPQRAVSTRPQPGAAAHNHKLPPFSQPQRGGLNPAQGIALGNQPPNVTSPEGAIQLSPGSRPRRSPRPSGVLRCCSRLPAPRPSQASRTKSPPRAKQPTNSQLSTLNSQLP